jgi:hypothetical protein
MCTVTAHRVHVAGALKLHPRYIYRMSSRNVGSVALVILLGLVIGVLGVVAADLYTVGVLILFIGGVGLAVVIGDYLIRYLGSRQPRP